MSLYTIIFGEAKPTAEELAQIARQKEKERLAKEPKPVPYSKTKKYLIWTALFMFITCFLFLCYEVITSHRQSKLNKAREESTYMISPHERIRSPTQVAAALTAASQPKQVFNVEVWLFVRLSNFPLHSSL